MMKMAFETLGPWVFSMHSRWLLVWRRHSPIRSECSSVSLTTEGGHTFGTLWTTLFYSKRPAAKLPWTRECLLISHTDFLSEIRVERRVEDSRCVCRPTGKAERFC